MGVDAGDEPVCPAIGIVGDEEVVTGLELAEQRVRCRHPTSERQPVGSPFQCRQALLEGVAGRVGGAAVVEAEVLADTRLGIGRGLEDGRHDRARARVRRLPGVDR
jgi:hypothetical protein